MFAFNPEIISHRRSVRTYDGRPLDDEDLTEIGSILGRIASLSTPFGNAPLIRIIDKKSRDIGQAKRLGTYGVIKGESGFLVSVSPVHDHDIVDTGFLLEHLVLSLAGMGIGTCWLGGTFKRQDFLGDLPMDDSLVIPAVIPFGRPKDRTRVMDGVMRKMAGSDSRKEWSELFFRDEFSSVLTRESAGIWEEVLEMVRLGPSASNKQPWRVLLSDDDRIAHLYIQQTPRYAGNSFGYNMQMLDAGIALCHVTSMLNHLSVSYQMTDSDPGLDIPEGAVYVKSIEIEKR
ncbi:MAG: nitroreductase family protein [Candidatus Methanomethylophilaceae archaeon]|nr:nitroreductase family protein [Candidatus Methanomethylophilaceae archaeon]